MQLTAKGEATRTRIVEATADAILAAGIGATSLDDVRAATATSKSQLFHYFPGGKADLVRAVVTFQSERVREAQRPALDTLDTLATWEAWAEAVLAHYRAQPHFGCPIGSLAAEASGTDPELAAAIEASMRDWRLALQAGLERMGARDPERVAASVFAGLQGGLLLTRTEQALWPLEAALDGALVQVRAAVAS